jgi:two-component system, LytTR family, response regulator LytT
MKLNCIAADDEPLALELIRTFILQTPFLNLVGSYSSGIKALEALHENSVDLIFLDIQMPGLTGMELAKIVADRQQHPFPRIVFTTAYNQYALEGYKVDAIDYLLKPFNFADFLRAATKARSYFERIQTGPVNDVSNIPSPSSDDYLFLKVEYQFIKVNLKDIMLIESFGDYVKVNLANDEKPILSLTSLKALEERLPSGRFMRIHRSYIISLDHVTAVSRSSVTIRSTVINVTDQYKEPFARFINGLS